MTTAPPAAPPPHLGAELRRLRLHAGLSLRATARLADVDAAHLSRLETGQLDARLSTFARVAAALGYRLALSSAPPADPTR